MLKRRYEIEDSDKTCSAAKRQELRQAHLRQMHESINGQAVQDVLPKDSFGQGPPILAISLGRCLSISTTVSCRSTTTGPSRRWNRWRFAVRTDFFLETRAWVSGG